MVTEMDEFLQIVESHDRRGVPRPRDGCWSCANESDFSSLNNDGPCQGCRRALSLVNWKERDDVPALPLTTPKETS